MNCISIASVALAVLAVPPASSGQGGEREGLATAGTTPLAARLHFADYDRDGFPDLYVVHPAGEDRLLRNAGDGTFQDVTTSAGLGGSMRTRLVLWRDYDGDHDQDLLVVSAMGRCRLLRNGGRGGFEDVGWRSGLDRVSDIDGADWIDIDADGLQDLHLVTTRGDVLLHNLDHSMFQPVQIDLPVLTEFAQEGPPLESPKNRAVNACEEDATPPGTASRSKDETKATRRPLPIPSGPTASPPSSGPSFRARGTSAGAGSSAPGTQSLEASVGNVRVIQDQDLDTRVHTEESPDEDQIRFDTKGVQRMIIDASGRVGIGTDSPDQELEVVGDFRLSSGALEFGGTSRRILSTSSDLTMESGRHLYLSPADSLIVNTDSLVVDQQGDVGIGIMFPEYPLHVLGYSLFQGAVEITGDLDVDGELKLGADTYGTDLPIIFSMETIPADTIKSTGYDSDDYNVMIGGFRALDGDINEDDAGDIIQVYTKVGTDGNWWIHCDFRSHSGDNEHWEVGVVAISKKMSHSDTWF